MICTASPLRIINLFVQKMHHLNSSLDVLIGTFFTLNFTHRDVQLLILLLERKGMLKYSFKQYFVGETSPSVIIASQYFIQTYSFGVCWQTCMSQCVGVFSIWSLSILTRSKLTAFTPQGIRGNDRWYQRLHRLCPPELCWNEQVMGENAASGSQPRPREEREGTTRAEDSGGHQPSSPQPAGGCQRGQVQTGVCPCCIQRIRFNLRLDPYSGNICLQ